MCPFYSRFKLYINVRMYIICWTNSWKTSSYEILFQFVEKSLFLWIIFWLFAAIVAYIWPNIWPLIYFIYSKGSTKQDPNHENNNECCLAVSIVAFTFIFFFYICGRSVMSIVLNSSLLYCNFDWFNARLAIKW